MKPILVLLAIAMAVVAGCAADPPERVGLVGDDDAPAVGVGSLPTAEAEGEAPNASAPDGSLPEAVSGGVPPTVAGPTSIAPTTTAVSTTTSTTTAPPVVKCEEAEISPVFFDSGSSHLHDEQKDRLREELDGLTGVHRADVIGTADPRPIAGGNEALSLARAEVVAAEIRRHSDAVVDAVVGAGVDVVSGETAMSQMRRVDIVLDCGGD